MRDCHVFSMRNTKHQRGEGGGTDTSWYCAQPSQQSISFLLAKCSLCLLQSLDKDYLPIPGALGGTATVSKTDCGRAVVHMTGHLSHLGRSGRRGVFHYYCHILVDTNLQGIVFWVSIKCLSGDIETEFQDMNPNHLQLVVVTTTTPQFPRKPRLGSQLRQSLHPWRHMLCTRVV